MIYARFVWTLNEALTGMSCPPLDTTRKPRPGEENGKGMGTVFPLSAPLSQKVTSSLSVLLQLSLLEPFCGPFCVWDYHYVTREAMQAGIDNGEFIENADFSGNMYGTSKAAVQDVQAKNLICILDIDMQGVRNIKRTELNPIYISIQPPSMEVLVSTERQFAGCMLLSKLTNGLTLKHKP